MTAPGAAGANPRTVPQDGARIATDLHSLLHNAGVPGPYALTGHSFGGLYVRSYAAQYPDDVAGLVLVDSTEAAPNASPNTGAGSYDAMGRVSAALSAAARLGLLRVVAQFSYASLPRKSRNEARASMATATHVAQHRRRIRRGQRVEGQAQSLVDFGGSHCSS